MIQTFYFIDPDKLSEPRNGAQAIYLDSWWSVDSVGRIALYSNGRQSFGRQPVSPQCNTEEAVAKRVSARLGFTSPVKQIPVVYLSWAEESGPRLTPAELADAVKDVAS